MTTTPEQLTKLTNDAKLAYFNDGTIGISHEPIEAYVSGYLRAKQETEQAIKDARKEVIEDCANFANGWAMEHVIEDDANLIVGDYVIKSMELLK